MPSDAARFESSDPEITVESSAIDPGELARASRILGWYGVRLLQRNDTMQLGVWSWLDSAALRAASRVCGSEQVPVVYLDGLNVPHRLKEFRGAKEFDGEPLPLEVVEAMYRHPAEPWKVRDQLLTEMGWHPGASEAEWRGIAVNRALARAGAAESTVEVLEREEEDRKAWIEEKRRVQRARAGLARRWRQSREEADE
jgi:hypothetical protein